MVFGEIKTIIEENFVNTYANRDEFKKTLKTFKDTFLKNKDLSKMYSLYNELSTPKGLSESEAKDYLNEGIAMIKSLKDKVKLPKSKTHKNSYKDIDNLVYENYVSIAEAIDSRKRIISVLKDSPEKNTPIAKIPVSSMIKIARKNFDSYLSTLNEDTKKEINSILSEDKNLLKESFENMKDAVIKKLKENISSDNPDHVNEQINNTITKIISDDFNYLTYYKLKELNNSI